MKRARNIGLWIVLAVAFTALRWPELLPSNFSPVYATFLCAGTLAAGSGAWILPCLFMLVSDLAINVFYYQPLGFSTFGWYMPFNYGLGMLLVCWGRRFTADAHPATLILSGMLGGVAFFAVTNGLTWMMDPGYPKSFSGLVQAFTIGKPGYPPTWIFFRNAAAGGAVFTALIVLAVRWKKAGSGQRLVPTQGA